MFVFYRTDIRIPKWVMLCKNVGLNPGIVVSCCKNAIFIFALGYLL